MTRERSMKKKQTKSPARKPASKKPKSVSFENLQEIVDAAVKKAQENAAPYVDPKRKTVDEAMRKAMREARVEQESRIKKFQDDCSHLQGSCCVSESTGNLTSIVWHGMDRGGEIVGICQNCQRVFHPSDADYQKWFEKPSGNIMSAGGGGLVNPHHRSFPYAGVPTYGGTKLDKLPDEEIKELYESTSELFKQLKPVLDVNKVLGRDESYTPPLGCLIKWEDSK